MIDRAGYAGSRLAIGAHAATRMDSSDAMQCLSPENARVLAYWTEKAGKRPIPARRDLDPVVDLRDLIKYLFLVDVDEGGKGFRFRIVGTGLVDYHGTDVTGKRLDELAGSERYFSQMEEQFEAAVRTRKPMRGEFCLPSEFTNHETLFEQLLLPLSDDGSVVNMLLGTFNPPSEEIDDEEPSLVVFDLSGHRAGDGIDVGQSQR